jgi:aminomethyltransferase
MPAGKAWYMPLLNDRGGMIDDIIVYKISNMDFYIIVNADNVQKDFDWFLTLRTRFEFESTVEMEDLTAQLGLLAVQGPKSFAIVEKALGVKLDSLKYYTFMKWQDGMIARTGYTGEDGFEIMVGLKNLQDVWNRLMKTGPSLGLKPVGFGAQDTLRLEAAMPLYGHDMNDDISPVELGIEWAVDYTKNSFVGKEALREIKAAKEKQSLIGFEMVDRGIPRQGFDIHADGKKVGHVTSGSYGPTVQKNIGLGYVSEKIKNSKLPIEVIIRDKPVSAKIVSLPFYRRAK